MSTSISYKQQLYALQFFMGLNDSFSHICSQILLMDPLPTISKVFSLVLQEESQREIHSLTLSSAGPMALLAKHDMSRFTKPYMKKERPRCSHCGVPGHVIEKWYKLHGFPPGFCTKQKNAVTNQVSSTVADSSSSEHIPQLPFTSEHILQLPFTSEQCA